ncbi:MAG: PD-(D/E)XK nuclease family protein [Patescibacteria group bacterium]|nr:PD-(D/E)XK nuclease family protein [Patescibacteria group bacterium]
MPPDKYTAVWVSHTSIGDFLRCPRAYFLKNVYRDPKNNHKIKLMSPSLALGQCVHEVLESLSILPKNRRLEESLVKKLDTAWGKVSGEKGGFPNEEIEYKYKMRGQEMMRRVMNHPGPITGLSVKINMDLPFFWLSEEENIILCGKIDWLEFLPETDSVHIIDFKTGRSEEDPDSLQLPIYHLLVHHCQKRAASKASYWYLDYSDTLTEKTLPDLDASRQKVLAIAQEIKLARQLARFKCPSGADGCPDCRPFETILRGEAKFVGEDGFRNDVYILNKSDGEDREGTVL